MHKKGSWRFSGLRLTGRPILTFGHKPETEGLGFGVWGFGKSVALPGLVLLDASLEGVVLTLHLPFLAALHRVSSRIRPLTLHPKALLPINDKSSTPNPRP